LKKSRNDTDTIRSYDEMVALCPACGVSFTDE